MRQQKRKVTYRRSEADEWQPFATFADEEEARYRVARFARLGVEARAVVAEIDEAIA